MLINDLSVADAQHLLQYEGGPLETRQVVIRAISIAVVAAFCAYAIWVGKATVWHLALPMVGEYLVLLVAVPITYLIVRHEAMKKDVIGGLCVLLALAAALAIGAAVRSYRSGMLLAEQASADLQIAWRWVVDHKIQWAIIAAAVLVLVDLPGRVGNLMKFGPPFYAVNSGCGMRIAVLFLGLFLVPVVLSASATQNAWILWTLLVVAEVLALWMHLDIQQRLRKLEATDKER
jgi:hypothetical protein